MIDLPDGATVTVTAPTIPRAVAAPPNPAAAVLTVRTVVGGAGGAHVHTQGAASASWTVTHGLGRRVAVAVWVADELVLADVQHLDSNSVSVVLAEPATGFAVIT